MLVCMDPSSPPVMRTFHLLKTPDILLANDNRLPVNYQSVNTLISVNYSFRHVGTIRLTLAPHPLEILSHLHGISTPLAPEDSV